jgi:hypothetical protein
MKTLHGAQVQIICRHIAPRCAALDPGTQREIFGV